MRNAFFFRRLLIRGYCFGVLRFAAELYFHLGQHAFFLIWAIAAGILTGCAVAPVRMAAGMLESFFLRGRAGLFYPPFGYFLFFLLPLVGMVLAFCVKRLMKPSDTSSDMTRLIEAVRSRRPGKIKLETFSHILASPLAIGFGASAGLTTPGVLAGASIGGSLGRFLHLRPEKALNLMICGTSAGIAAIFGSPVAGVLFAVEILIPKMNTAKLVPVLLSAASATVTAQIFLGKSPFFSMLCSEWDTSSVPGYFLLGILCAPVGILMIRLNESIHCFLMKSFPGAWSRLIFSGLCCSALVFLIPALSGEGLLFIQSLKDHEFQAGGNMTIFCGLIVLLKIVATSLTISGGGTGGFFAPALFAGAFFGYFSANLFSLLGIHGLDDPNFLALGMCGVFAAGFRAPLTGIFLVAEMSGSYVLMIPLMLVGAVSYFSASFFIRDSLYVCETAEGVQPDETSLHVPVVGKHLKKVFPVAADSHPEAEALLRENPNAPFFPVIDSSGFLLGILPGCTVAALSGKFDPVQKMRLPLGTLHERDGVSRAAAAMRLFNRTSLPVTDGKNRYLGIFQKCLKKTVKNDTKR